MGRLVSGLNGLTLRLFQGMEGDGNVALSGTVIGGALALAAPGAREKTRAEFERLLPLQDGEASLAGGLRALLGSGDGQCVLGAASGAFVAEGLELLPDYVESLVRTGAAVQQLPFQRAPQEAREAIDRWARETTRGRIDELAGDVNHLTRLVLASGLHFSADWAKPFSTSMTDQAPFTLPSGEKVDVPMMRAKELWRFGRMEGVRVLELPYLCGKFSMLLIAPDRDDGEPSGRGSGTGLGLVPRGGGVDRPAPPPPQPRPEPVEARTLASVEAALTPEKLAAWSQELRPGFVELSLPRFQIRTNSDLRPVLEGLGMRAAFSERADFSGITRTMPLLVDAVSHRTVVDVDEAGTRAASAAAVIFGSRGTGPQSLRFDFNRPFLFAIRQNATGAILLLGRVADPREWAASPPEKEPAPAPEPDMGWNAIGGLRGGAGPR